MYINSFWTYLFSISRVFSTDLQCLILLFISTIFNRDKRHFLVFITCRINNLLIWWLSTAFFTIDRCRMPLHFRSLRIQCQITLINIFTGGVVAELRNTMCTFVFQTLVSGAGTALTLGFLRLQSVLVLFILLVGLDGLPLLTETAHVYSWVWLLTGFFNIRQLNWLHCFKQFCYDVFVAHLGQVLFSGPWALNQSEHLIMNFLSSNYLVHLCFELESRAFTAWLFLPASVWPI